jgi:hypothetical protein
MRNNKTKSIPDVFRLRGSLFWDVDPKTIDKKKHARYIIERVLEFGRDPEVRWVWQFYQPALLKKVVESSRVLSPKTRSLWTLLLKNK